MASRGQIEGMFVKKIGRVHKRMKNQQTLGLLWFIGLALFATVLLGTLIFATSAQAQDSASILTNSTVKLGVNPAANLGVSVGDSDLGPRLSSTDNGSAPGTIT